MSPRRRKDADFEPQKGPFSPEEQARRDAAADKAWGIAVPLLHKLDAYISIHVPRPRGVLERIKELIVEFRDEVLDDFAAFAQNNPPKFGAIVSYEAYLIGMIRKRIAKDLESRMKNQRTEKDLGGPRTVSLPQAAMAATPVPPAKTAAKESRGYPASFYQIRQQSAGALEELVDAETRERIGEILHRMPDGRRRVFELRYFEGKKPEPIRTQLGLTARQVDRYLEKGLKQLRKILVHEEDLVERDVRAALLRLLEGET